MVTYSENDLAYDKDYQLTGATVRTRPRGILRGPTLWHVESWKAIPKEACQCAYHLVSTLTVLDRCQILSRRTPVSDTHSNFFARCWINNTGNW